MFVCFLCSAAALIIWGGAIPLTTGSHALRVDFRAHDIILIESFRHVSILPTWKLRFHTGHVYSTTLWLTTLREHRRVVPDILRSKLFRFFNFCTMLSLCFLYVSERSCVTPIYLGLLSADKKSFAVWIFRVSFASLLFKWKYAEIDTKVFIFRYHCSK